ncbi:MAG: DUF3800 domain-containing protein [Leucobacter sp.]
MTRPEANDSPRSDSPPEPSGSGGLTAFVDESYSDRDYWIAAVVVDSEQFVRLSDGFSALRTEAAARWGVPTDVEFHAHDIMQGRGPWSPLLGRVGDAATLYRRLLRTVVDSGAQIAVQGVDVVRLQLRFQYPAAPHEVTLRGALEQVNSWPDSSGGSELIRVVCDEVGMNQTQAQQMIARVTEGTSLAASSGWPGVLDRITPSVNYVSSAVHDGVQAADLVAHIVRRDVEETAASTPARRLARSLHNSLAPALRHEFKWRP